MRIRKGNNGKAISTVVNINGSYPDLLGSDIASVKFRMYYVKDGKKVDKVAATTTGVEVQPEQEFVVDTANGVVKCIGNGRVSLEEVTVDSTFSLPADLVVNTRYFVTSPSPNAFGLAELPNSEAINLTTSGSGTLTYRVMGQLVYTLRAVDVNVVGFYTCLWIVTYTDGSVLEFRPEDRDNNLEIFE